jgi:hypothetical protein
VALNAHPPAAMPANSGEWQQQGDRRFSILRWQTPAIALHFF